jgi:hypothetical protein
MIVTFSANFGNSAVSIVRSNSVYPLSLYYEHFSTRRVARNLSHQIDDYPLQGLVRIDPGYLIRDTKCCIGKDTI